MEIEKEREKEGESTDTVIKRNRMRQTPRKGIDRETLRDR